MVTLLTLPNTSIKLIVNPINLLIVTFKDDKIYILNSSNNRILYFKTLGELANSNTLSEVLHDRADSYKNNSTIKELNEEYGIVAQKEAYKKN